METEYEKPLVLVVDDDPTNLRILVSKLNREYRLGVAKSGTKALEYMGKQIPDLVLLDVMMPDMDGYAVCEHIKRDPRLCDIPVVFISYVDDPSQKTRGFEVGGVDYITKPFDSKEMAARVKAVLRRTMGQTEEEEESNDDTLSFPGLTVSLSRYEVFYEGKKLEMPPKELEVLYFLASHVNQLFTRGQLLDQVWGFQVEVESRTVDVHVKRLRDKLVGCEKYGWRIQTIWGRGYKFEVIK